jgi:predicted NAD/FAD-dependent oxidoreductase
MTPPLRVAIIGGGVSGLSAALHLEKLGHDCLVFDTGRRGVGGRASSRGPVDHAAQFIAVDGRTETEAFRRALQGWIERGAAQKWRGRLLNAESADAGRVETLYVGSDAQGIGSVAADMAARLRTPPRTDAWVSPSNGIRRQNDGRWTVHSRGKPVGGVFDAVVVAHNGKCADRLTSRTPAKAINRLLRVQFSDRPSPTKMTLNSIYSLVVEVRRGVFRGDVDGARCPDSRVLDFCANNASKYRSTAPKHGRSAGTETWTLLSHPTYARARKQPQEHLEGTEISRAVTADMIREAHRILGVDGSSGGDAGGVPEKGVVSARLQLWGAGVPINRWVADDGSCFLWDAEHSIGVVGDWLRRSSISGAWESGEAFARFFAGQGRARSRGLAGAFAANAGSGGALVGGVTLGVEGSAGGEKARAPRGRGGGRGGGGGRSRGGGGRGRGRGRRRRRRGKGRGARAGVGTEW